VALIVTSIVGGLPLALFKLSLLRSQQADQRRQQQQQSQEQLHKHLIELQNASREGLAGDATRILFGMDDPPAELQKQ
jgi:hypothetical protein